MVDGDSIAQCSGASVTLQCILAGNTLTWNTPDGALNFVRNRGSESDADSYHGQLWELNSTHLRSTLTFTFSNQITINCSNDSASDSITVSVEGIHFMVTIALISERQCVRQKPELITIGSVLSDSVATLFETSVF